MQSVEAPLLGSYRPLSRPQVQLVAVAVGELEELKTMRPSFHCFEMYYPRNVEMEVL